MEEAETAGKSNKRVLLAAGLAVAALTILALSLWHGIQKKDRFFDTAALAGTLPGKSQEEIIAELNRVVDEGMFNISINTFIAFPDAKGEGVAGIENIAANRYNMTVEIVLRDTGETVYRSKGIKPGQYIEKIRLDAELPPGSHPATAVFTAHAQEDGYQVVGQAAAEITLEVGG